MSWVGMERRLRCILGENTHRAVSVLYCRMPAVLLLLTFVKRIEVECKGVFCFRKTFVHLLIFCAF